MTSMSTMIRKINELTKFLDAQYQGPSRLFYIGRCSSELATKFIKSLEHRRKYIYKAYGDTSFIPEPDKKYLIHEHYTLTRNTNQIAEKLALLKELHKQVNMIIGYGAQVTVLITSEGVSELHINHIFFENFISPFCVFRVDAEKDKWQLNKYISKCKQPELFFEQNGIGFLEYDDYLKTLPPSILTAISAIRGVREKDPTASVGVLFMDEYPPLLQLQLSNGIEAIHFQDIRSLARSEEQRQFVFIPLDFWGDKAEKNRGFIKVMIGAAREQGLTPIFANMDLPENKPLETLVDVLISIDGDNNVKFIKEMNTVSQ